MTADTSAIMNQPTIFLEEEQSLLEELLVVQSRRQILEVDLYKSQFNPTLLVVSYCLPPAKGGAPGKPRPKPTGGPPRPAGPYTHISTRIQHKIQYNIQLVQQAHLFQPVLQFQHQQPV